MLLLMCWSDVDTLCVMLPPLQKISEPLFPKTPVGTPSKQLTFPDDENDDGERKTGADGMPQPQITPVSKRTRSKTPSKSRRTPAPLKTSD